ncbi:MAG: hypothetical protein ACR2KV_10665 [Solirubrobacteraceae bacterium]
MNRARQLGPIPLTAHDVFRAIDVELVLIAVVVVGIIVAGELRGRPLLADGDAGAVTALGAIAFLHRRLPDRLAAGAGRRARAAGGAWVALVCSAAVVVGGLLCREAPPARVPAAAADAPPADLSW